MAQASKTSIQPGTLASDGVQILALAAAPIELGQVVVVSAIQGAGRRGRFFVKPLTDADSGRVFVALHNQPAVGGKIEVVTFLAIPGRTGSGPIKQGSRTVGHHVEGGAVICPNAYVEAVPAPPAAKKGT